LFRVRESGGELEEWNIGKMGEGKNGKGGVGIGKNRHRVTGARRQEQGTRNKEQRARKEEQGKN
jgi:hypothetical protein